MDSQSDHFVTWGRQGRTLEYRDSEGEITFTLDMGAKGEKSICLEHHPSKWPRGPRYDLAFQQAKQFLESKGFDVEIYDATSIDWNAVRAAQVAARHRYIDAGTLTVDPQPKGKIFSSLLTFIKKLFRS